MLRPNSNWLKGVALVMGGLFACQGSGDLALDGTVPDQVDYNLHIRPILSDKCFKCHGPDHSTRKEDLRLDYAEGAYAALKDDSNRHVIVPGHPETSELYRRISSTDTADIMPPPESYLSLTPLEIKTIEKWIKQGAEYKPHWAYLPIVKPSAPKIKNEAWVRNDIDRFILAQMEPRKLKPNPEADKERLLKRLAYDLVGLPPTLDMQDRFLKDDSPEAYDKIIDELMSDPHFGEKWALYWLDVARYADSHGYQDDGPRSMWPWRDWVIHAFNANYPFDKFLTWQLAGDLLPNPNKEMLLATGFNRNHKITQEGGVIDEEYRIEYVTDRTNTFGKAFLGMTFECAKCHDHKYDPISQKEYFSTFAFFNQLNEKGLLGDISLNSYADPPNLRINRQDIDTLLSFINHQDSQDVTVMIMKDSSVVRPTHLLRRGNYDAPDEIVPFSTPSRILPFDTTKFAPNRLGLAQWLLDEANPLTARVVVNRLWQEIFGQGIVRTSGDFGLQGELPTHPELLDYLATYYRENGWDTKKLIKHMLTSATYRQSATVSQEQLERDPDNRYYSRGTRLRYKAEMVRDMALASSGLLNKTIGGPSVKTYQPEGIWEASTSGRGELARYRQDKGEKLYRRGMYNFIKRTVPPPVMLMFDASNRDQCEVKRTVTNTPLQALVMINDPHIGEASRVLADQLIQQSTDAKTNITTAFRSIVCRQPKKEELDQLLNYFVEEQTNFAAEPQKAGALLRLGEASRSTFSDQAALAALTQVIHTIYNLEEVITKT